MNKNISKYLNICNFYIAFWLLYNIHWNSVGEFFPRINALSNLFLAINLVISIYCTIKVLQKFMSIPLLKVTSCLVTLFVIYGVFSLFEGSSPVRGTIDRGTYLIGALRTFLPIYTFFLFSKMGYITEKSIRIWFWVFLAQTLFIFMLFRDAMGLEEMDEMRTNNRGYLFVYLFPYLFFFREKPIIQYILIALFMIGALFSLKRGAILCTALAVSFFFWIQMAHLSVKRKALVLIIFFVFLVYGTRLVVHMYENSIVFQHRVENTLDGNTSGRDVIADNLLEIYSNSNIFHVIFGFGADGTLHYGNYAHNDWLEMLFDQGLVGFFVYLSFWFIFFSLWRKEVQRKSSIAFFLGLLFICNFPKTLFSMWYSNANMFITMLLGYALYLVYNNEMLLKRKKILKTNLK